MRGREGLCHLLTWTGPCLGNRLLSSAPCSLSAPRPDSEEHYTFFPGEERIRKPSSKTCQSMTGNQAHVFTNLRPDRLPKHQSTHPAENTSRHKQMKLFSKLNLRRKGGGKPHPECTPAWMGLKPVTRARPQLQLPAAAAGQGARTGSTSEREQLRRDQANTWAGRAEQAQNPQQGHAEAALQESASMVPSVREPSLHLHQGTQTQGVLIHQAKWTQSCPKAGEHSAPWPQCQGRNCFVSLPEAAGCRISRPCALQEALCALQEALCRTRGSRASPKKTGWGRKGNRTT